MAARERTRRTYAAFLTMTSSGCADTSADLVERANLQVSDI